jgi:hypothetical protein
VRNVVVLVVLLHVAVLTVLADKDLAAGKLLAVDLVHRPHSLQNTNRDKAIGSIHYVVLPISTILANPPAR